MQPRYEVLAGAVTVEMGIPDVPGARARQDVRRGMLLPEDVPQSEIRALLELGEIRPVDAEAEAPHDDPPADQFPQGMSVATTLDWVGNDVERAKRALEAEKAMGEFARATAVDRLEKLIAAAGD